MWAAATAGQTVPSTTTTTTGQVRNVIKWSKAKEDTRREERGGEGRSVVSYFVFFCVSFGLGGYILYVSTWPLIVLFFYHHLLAKRPNGWMNGQLLVYDRWMDGRMEVCVLYVFLRRIPPIKASIVYFFSPPISTGYAM